MSNETRQYVKEWAIAIGVVAAVWFFLQIAWS